jgi:hypothetical protein
MRSTGRKRSTRPGTKAPSHGTYNGTVDGRPAVILANADVIHAMWFRTGLDGIPRPHQDAWDVIEGRFQAMSDGQPVRCTIAAGSRHDEVDRRRRRDVELPCARPNDCGSKPGNTR